MLLRILLLLTLCVGLFAQGSDVLTNETIAKMYQSGVPAAVIIRTIDAAPRVDFRFLPADLAYFASVNLPEDVFKAMAAKSANKPIAGSQQVAAPTPPVPTQAPERQRQRREPRVQAPAPPPAPDYDDDAELKLGHVEIGVFGGGNGGPYRSPFRAVSYSVGADVTVGLMRHLALTGLYAFDNIGSGDVVSCPIVNGRVTCTNVHVREKAHEFMGGVKVPFPMGRVFSPYVQGSVGGVRVVDSASASAVGINVGLSAGESRFAFAPGGGFDFHVARHFGIEIDLRAVKIMDVEWQYRATGGVLIRF